LFLPFQPLLPAVAVAVVVAAVVAVLAVAVAVALAVLVASRLLCKKALMVVMAMRTFGF
jgi:hypothetical protein